MTATTALAYLQLQPNLLSGEQMTFHLIGECGRFGLWPFWTYTEQIDGDNVHAECAKGPRILFFPIGPISSPPLVNFKYLRNNDRNPKKLLNLEPDPFKFPRVENWKQLYISGSGSGPKPAVYLYYAVEIQELHNFICTNAQY